MEKTNRGTGWIPARALVVAGLIVGQPVSVPSAERNLSDPLVDLRMALASVGLDLRVSIGTPSLMIFADGRWLPWTTQVAVIRVLPLSYAKYYEGIPQLRFSGKDLTLLLAVYWDHDAPHPSAYYAKAAEAVEAFAKSKGLTFRLLRAGIELK